MTYVLGAKESSSRSGIQLQGLGFGLPDFLMTAGMLRQDAADAVSRAYAEGRYSAAQRDAQMSRIDAATASTSNITWSDRFFPSDADRTTWDAMLITYETVRSEAQAYNAPKSGLDKAGDVVADATKAVSEGLGSGLFWGGILVAGALAWKLSRKD